MRGSTGRPAVSDQAWATVQGGVTWSRLSRLDKAIQAWKATYGSLPQTLAELVEAGLVDPRFLHDPERRPFHYEVESKGYLIGAVDDAGRERPEFTLDRRPGGR